MIPTTEEYPGEGMMTPPRKGATLSLETPAFDGVTEDQMTIIFGAELFLP